MPGAVISEDGLRTTDPRYIRLERACFEGLLLTVLTYGALLMIIIQIFQVLWLRPKRGRIFYGIIMYSVYTFFLATFAVAGRAKYAETMYVENRKVPGGYIAYYKDSMDRWENVLDKVCLVLMPWILDLLMIYRLYILWNYNRWILGVPVVTHLGRMATSIPFIILTAKPDDPYWGPQTRVFKMANFSLFVAANLMFTTLIAVRLYTLREKVEHVLGKLQSVPYTSMSTIFVESGALLTLWSIVHLALFVLREPVAEVFQQPLIYLNAITRLLIVLRMAQNRAWCRDIITASATGILDWQVSSSHSIPLHDTQNNQPQLDKIKNLPRKYREDDSP
ncbi:hypothetical protein FA15DRAFT_666414 [Coprinopsis marcescibilis]|uniref:Uncharacterized protein n=1 Tax=Coprinopsis marcescibilis TaxID=230819 RepID=A0A5C3L2Y5_COPMA|nr:hypothetical protein FA15DRAFT_666414 [Coprinopsis marcescibilis]